MPIKNNFLLITIFLSSRPFYANQTFDRDLFKPQNPFVNVTRNILGPISVIIYRTIQSSEYGFSVLSLF